LVSPVCARATFGTPRSTELAALMLPCASLLGITDETSVAIALAALGAACSSTAVLLGDRRGKVLLSFARWPSSPSRRTSSYARPLRPEAGAAARDGAARIVELNRPAHPLWDGVGLRYLMFDLLPLAGPYSGRRFGRGREALARPGWPSRFCLCGHGVERCARRQDPDKWTGRVEVERFFIGVFFVVLAVALWLLPENATVVDASSLVVFGCLVPTFYTVWWFRESAPSVLAGAESAHPDLGRTSIRSTAGASPRQNLASDPSSRTSTAASGTSTRPATPCSTPDTRRPPWRRGIRPAFLKPGHLAAFERMAPRGGDRPRGMRERGPPERRRVSELRRSSGCSPINELFVRVRAPQRGATAVLAAGL